MVLRTWLMAAGLCLVAGCCERYKCAAPAVQLTVTDDQGRTVPAPIIQGENVTVRTSCPPDRACVHQLSGAGALATVTAPGFKSVVINLERETDDCGNTLTRHVEVMLVPESQAEQSTSRLVRSSTCQ